MNTDKNVLKSATAPFTITAIVAACGLAVATPALAQPDDNDSDRRDAREQERATDTAAEAARYRAQLRESVREYDKWSDRRDWRHADIDDESEEWYDPTDWFDEDFAEMQRAYISWRQDERREEVMEDVRQRRVRNGMPPVETDRERGQNERYGDRNVNDREGENDRWLGTTPREDWNDTFARDRDFAADTLYNDSYYDGYYDGYYDDEFGYDNWDDDEMSDRPVVARGYKDGYYDGFYDKSRGYEMNATYYISMDPAIVNGDNSSKTREDLKKRQRDGSRQMGERANPYSGDRYSLGMRGFDENPNSADRDSADRDRMKRNTTREMSWSERSMRSEIAKRGTVKSVSNKTSDFAKHSGSESAKHTIVMLTFEDGKKVYADLGKTGDAGAFSKGDRVTLRGKTKEMDGKDVIRVSRFSVNGSPTWSRQHVSQMATEPTDND